jgi:hypothetical protein
MYRYLAAHENDTSVPLVAIDGSFVAHASIPASKVGIVLTLDGRAFLWSKGQSAYVEVPTVVLATEQAPDDPELIH